MDLFRTSVTVFLVDRLSSGLGGIGRSFEALEAKAARAQLGIRMFQNQLESSEVRLSRVKDVQLRQIGQERLGLQQQRLEIMKVQAAEAERMEARRVAIAHAHTQLIGGAVMAGVGAAGLFGLSKAVSAAGEFQNRMTAVHIAAMGTAEQMQRFGGIVRETSNLTMFSMSGVADMGRMMAISGIPMAAINALLPQVARSAELLFQLKGEDPLATAKAEAMVAHQLGIYTAKAMAPFNEVFEKLMLRSPELASAFVTQSGYLTPLATRGLKMDPRQVLELIATSEQITGAGKGALSGRNLATFLTRLLPGTGSAKQTAAVQQLGLASWFQHPDIEQLMTTLAADRARMGSARFSAFSKNAFGQRGLLVAELLSDETTRQQLERTQHALAQQKSTKEQLADLMQTYADQMMRFKTNFQNALIDFAYPTTKQLPAKIALLADALHQLDRVEVLHPERTRMLFEFTAGLAAVTTGAGLIAVLGGLSTLLGTAGIVASAGTLAIALPAVALGIVALAEAYEHRKGIFDAMKNLAHLPPLPGSAAAGAEGMGDLLKKHPGWRPPPPSSGIWMKPPVVARPGGLPDWYSPKADPRAMPGGITPAAYFPSVESGGVVVNCTVNMGAGAASAEELADRLAPILTDKMIHALRATTSGGGVYESPYFHTGSGVSGA